MGRGGRGGGEGLYFMHGYALADSHASIQSLYTSTGSERSEKEYYIKII